MSFMNYASDIVAFSGDAGSSNGLNSRFSRMKGVVFTEFLELAEQRFGLEVVDRIIQQSHLQSDGAYTSVGTYDDGELLQLVTHLSRASGIPVPTLVKTFGKHLFNTFAAAYPHLWKGIRSAPDFLSKVEGFIHMEVQKLYPDAKLPRIEFTELEEETWELRYTSTRPFADLAAGLIEACIEYFGEEISVLRENIGHQDGTSARFLLQKQTKALSCRTVMC